MAGGIKQTKISTAIHYSHSYTETQRFFLSDLANEHKLAKNGSIEEFQRKTGLSDFFWQAIYYQHPYHKRSFSQVMAEAEGYVFFMHGWDGSHRIWEELPYDLAIKNKQIVCFNLDVNGFGLSSFLNDTPPPEQCNPAALMATVEHWLDDVKLWPTSTESKKPFYLFVGHSMSGAALFYKNVDGWKNEKYGFYALAPALFCNDSQRRAFFKTMGLMGMHLPPSLNAIKNVLAPHVIDLLGTGASPTVKNEHLRVYNQTSFGTIAQVIYAMGAFAETPRRSDWSRFKVALGYKDRIVNLVNMLELLETLTFRSDQIHVMLGDHYFFSYGTGSPLSHKQNQQFLLEDLHAFCRQLAQESYNE